MKTENNPATTNKNTAIGYTSALGVLIIFIAIYFIGCDNENKSEKVSISDESSSDSILMKSSIGQFKLLFNHFAAQNNLHYRINKLPSDTGKSFSYLFSDHIGITGTFDDERKLNSATVITDCKENPADILLCFAGLIYVTNPTLLPEERGEILKKVGIVGNNNMQKINGTTIKNNIKYFSTYNESTGLWFGAEKINQ